MQDSVEAYKWITEFFKALGISLPPAVAGFVGAMISLRFLPKLTWWQVWANLGIGFVVAGYFTASVMHYLPSWQPGAIGFGIGFMAFCALGGLTAILNDWREQPGEAVKKWLPWFKRGDQ